MHIGKAAKFNALNESGEYVNKFSSDLLNRIGVIQSSDNDFEKLSIIDQVNVYLKRFPEVEYLIDMLSSSVIYTSSSNTKKIQVTLNGEYKVISNSTDNINKTESSSAPNYTDSTTDSAADNTNVSNKQPSIEIKDVNISEETIDKVDS